MANLRGQDVHVLDRAETGPKPDLVRALGATYHSGSVLDVGFEPDIIIECTGVGQVIAESFQVISVRAGSSVSRALDQAARATRLPLRTSRRRWS